MSLPGATTVLASPSGMTPTRPTVRNVGIVPPVAGSRPTSNCVILPEPSRRDPETSAMLEIEVKYRLTDSAAVVTRLTSWGATVIADHAEADHYLNAPDRDFARTDES